MANLKSAKKRIRTNEKTRARYKSYRSKMRTCIKRVESYIEANDVDNAKEAFKEASRVIDKTIQKGAIHENNGNRHKTRLAQKIKQLSA